MSSIRQAPLILFVAYPGTGLLGLTSPQTAFWAAPIGVFASTKCVPADG